VIIAIIAAALLGVAGAGIFAIPVVAVLLFGAAFLFMRQARSPDGAVAEGGTPQDTDHSGRFQRTGYATEGQAHMTPEQIER
jgi:hypothetical protein